MSLVGNASGSAEVVVDTSGFAGALRQWWSMQHPDLEKMLKEEVALLGRALMLWTPPFAPGGGKGLSLSAYKATKNRILRETNLVFKPMWQIPSIEIAKKDRFDIFQQVRKEKVRYRNKVGGAQSQMMQSFYRDKDPLKGFLRMQQMFKHKAITGNTLERRTIGAATYGLRGNFRTMGRIKSGQRKVVYYVSNYDSIKEAGAPALERIGRMKAGWNQAVISITGKGVADAPAWVTRHSGTGSGSNRLTDLYNPQAVLKNSLGNTFDLANKFNTVQRAFDLREKNLKAKIKSYLSSLTRRTSIR
ncbi:hypothetical protein UFOVP510_37 [uncultured Caudovirales phage]|uniref:Uncharacterized protein n=1 Tax=uncultured Caudovirales phage TaxID=2100421 RepID=A0A6J5MQM7_9CAUD|nr:hypothetical protein UFOVP510_37 [uncultured Caudovirales phage]